MSSKEKGSCSASNQLAASSIVDLKAELYRKQLEYQKRKSSAPTSGNFVRGQKTEKKKSQWRCKNPGVEKRKQADELNRQCTDEDKLIESRRALEAKAKLYDKMTHEGDNYEDDDGHSLYLVDFERKFVDSAMEQRSKRLEKEAKRKTALESGEVDTTPVYVEPDTNRLEEEDQWVDYTDSFGRSRTCLKKDLPRLQSLDNQIKQDTASDQPVHQQSASSASVPDLLSEDMRRELLRQKWEQEQTEMLEKQDTVHYSNVQFDELRTHGVAYYQFSKDEEKRADELEKLNKQREETKSVRAAKEKLKDKRKALLNARLEKVKQRRIAQGKPVPETPGSSKDDSDTEETIGPVPSKEIAGRSPAEEEKSRSELEVKSSSESKPVHIRDWDRGKEGLWIPQRPQKPRGWNDPRNTRDEEFAPPSFYYNTSTSTSNKLPASTILHSPSTNRNTVASFNQAGQLLTSTSESTATAVSDQAPEKCERVDSNKHDTVVAPVPTATAMLNTEDRPPVLFKLGTSATAGSSSNDMIAMDINVGSIPLPTTHEPVDQVSPKASRLNIEHMLKQFRYQP